MSEAHAIVLVRKQIGEFAGISDFRPNPRDHDRSGASSRREFILMLALNFFG